MGDVTGATGLALLYKRVFEQNPRGRREQVHPKANISERGNRKCKGPVVGK